jgi:hypothetical protein
MKPVNPQLPGTNVETEQEKQTQPYPLALDIDQWRRDIRTFSDATGQVLEAIVSELSASCSDHRSRGLPHRPASNPSPQDRDTFDSVCELPGDDRLAQIKSQIAARLAKTN